MANPVLTTDPSIAKASAGPILTTKSGPGFPLPVAPGSIPGYGTTIANNDRGSMVERNPIRFITVIGDGTLALRQTFLMSGKGLMIQHTAGGLSAWKLYFNDDPEPLYLDCGALLAGGIPNSTYTGLKLALNGIVFNKLTFEQVLGVVSYLAVNTFGNELVTASIA